METYLWSTYSLYTQEMRWNTTRVNKKASDIFLYRRLHKKRRLPTLPQTQYHRRDKA